MNDESVSNPEEKTFLRVTNRMIYDDIKLIKEEISKMNKKSTMTKWIAGSSLAVSTFLAGAIIVGKII